VLSTVCEDLFSTVMCSLHYPHPHHCNRKCRVLNRWAGTYWIHPEDGGSKALLNIGIYHKTIQCHISKDTDLNLHLHENLKSYNSSW